MILSSAMMISLVPVAHAQQIGGGVNVPGEWWLGEGLKQGDYFEYRLCHVDYKECTSFDILFWIQGDKQVGSESKWLAKAVAYDGGRVYKGEMEFGKIAAEPTGGTDNLITYRSAVKSSISWLSSFATSYGGEGGEGPKEFSRPSWGKIGNIGGEQVAPQEAESITVPAGTFDTIRVGWKTGGAHSHIWIVDNFPFPIKANTWTHVASGHPPPEYVLTLIDYKENVTEDPFVDIVSSAVETAALGCPDNSNIQFTTIKKSTLQFAYGLEVGYKPESPKQGCDIEWLIKFKNKYDQNEFLNQVQYDIMVVDKDVTLPPIRSLADDESKQYLYSPSGLAERIMPVKEPVGENLYLIIVYGLAPEHVVPDFTKTPIDYLIVPLTVRPASNSEPEEAKIPGWIKDNAGLWSDGMIDDNTFVAGLQYLIREGIIVIPDTQQGTGSGSSVIPGWIKDNAGLWSDGMIDDNTFVAGIQYLIRNGIILIFS